MILAIILLLTITAAAQAEEPSCSVSRAAADWTFTDNGTVIGVGPRAALGKFTLTAGGTLVERGGQVQLVANPGRETS
jgi:hypothetical protein